MLAFEEENLTMEQVLEKTNELIAAYTKADQDMEKSILAMVEASKQQHLSVQQMQEFNDILSETDVNGMIPSASSEDESSGSTEEDEEYIPVDSVEKIPLWESTDVTQMASLDTKIVNVRKNILTVKVPKRMQDNIATGHLYVDRLMAGDGVTPSTACLVTGIAGSGKCLGKGTPVLMFDGSIKKVEDIVVGDLLMGPDSTSRKVLSLARGKEEMFKIIPRKGESWICNRSHILSLVYSNKYKEHIKNISVNDFLKIEEKKRVYYKQYRTGVDFDKKQLPVDPYLFGLWLGDGTKMKPEITTTNSEIENYIDKWAANNGYRTSKYLSKKNKNVKQINIVRNIRGKSVKSPIKQFFLSCVVNGEKSIPHEYLTSNREDRLKVLSGIIDTDGHKGLGYYEIIAKDDRLANDILYLSRSLGFAAYSRKCKKTIKSIGFSGEYNRITISGSFEELSLLLKYKQLPKRKQIKNVLRTGIKVESIGIGDYYGFEIDGDHLFMLGDFTVTHNTSMLIQVADAIMGSGNIAIYNSNEESSVQVSRVVNRLRLKNGFEFTEYENVFDLIKHVKKVQEQAYEEYSEMFDRMKENGASGYRLSKLKPKQVFLFVDSLQTMQMPHWVYDANLDIVHDMKGEPLKKIGRAPQGDNMHLMIARYLTEWCKKTYGICFIIGQVTKDGEFAGKSGIKHWVDAHMHLDIDRDRKSKTYNERIAEMTKNRFGSSGVYYSFEITSRGLVFKNPDKPA